MRYVYTGDGVTIAVPFLVEGELVVPDDDSVFYTLRDNAGVGMAGLVDVAVPAANGHSTTPIAISGSKNTAAGLFENRTLSVKFTVGGGDYGFETSYRVIAFVPKTASPADVRSFLGLSTTELSDDEIDLTEAYLTLSAQLGGTILADALKAGTVATLTANKALVYQVVADVIPSLQTRILQQEQKDTTRYARVADFDFGAMAIDAASYLGAAVAALSGATPVLPSLVAVGGRTDVVTNA